MSYVKQNFASGQTLLASHLNHIEDGIDNISTEVNKSIQEAAKQAAETAQQAAASSASSASTSASTATTQAAAAKSSADAAASSATAAKASEAAAEKSAQGAAASESAAKAAQTAAETAKANADTAASNAAANATAAANSAVDAKKTLESIPDDYNILSGKVDENTSGISKLKEDIADVTEALKSDNAKMSLFRYGKINSSTGLVEESSTQLVSKIFIMNDGETISVPNGFKLRVVSYSGVINEDEDTAQYFNGISPWVDSYTYDKSSDALSSKRIGIYKSGDSELTLDTLQGYVKTTISALVASENVNEIHELAKKNRIAISELTNEIHDIIQTPERISIYNAFDLSRIKHGYENGNIAMVAESGKTQKVKLLGNKTGDWTASFALDALYRYEVNTNITIEVTDGTNTLTIKQTDSTADTYKKYFYMTVDYNGTVKTDVHLLTASKTFIQKDGILTLELGDFENPITLGEFGTADITIIISAGESAENVYYIKDFKSTLCGFELPIYNLYIRDNGFAEDENYIYLVYYVNAIAQLTKMNKKTGDKETVALSSMRADIDSHNQIAIALHDGNLHIAGGCHASELKYYTGQASDLSTIAKSTTLSESSATYPEFVTDGTTLYFICRSGTSGSSYDVAYKLSDGAWVRTTSSYIDDGTNGNGGTCYFSPWELLSDGYFYSTFTWRNNGTGVPGVGANMRVCVAKTRDFTNFYDISDNLLTLPMTIGNTENCIVDDVGQNHGLLNQVGMGVFDADSVPIVWYFKNDEYGNRNLYFASYQSGNWNIFKATNFIGKSVLQGVGTIDALISRMKFSYGADYGNAVIFAMDYFGRSYIVEVDNKGQSNCKNTELVEYECGSEQICVSKKHGSFVTQITQRTLFDRNLPQRGNGLLTVFC